MGLELRVEGDTNKRLMKDFDNKKHGWLKMAVEIVIVIILVLIALSFVVGVSRVDGNSMEPTLENEQVVAFLRIGNDYNYGDIVAIKMPAGDRYVKRIIGLPGDTIDIQNGYVYRNGKRLEENYILGASVSETNMADSVDNDTVDSVDNDTVDSVDDNMADSVDNDTADSTENNSDSITGATGKVSPGQNEEGTTQPTSNRITYPFYVPQGKYWVLGDNRENSVDSRQFGPVIKENIKGRLLFQ